MLVKTISELVAILRNRFLVKPNLMKDVFGIVEEVDDSIDHGISKPDPAKKSVSIDYYDILLRSLAVGDFILAATDDFARDFFTFFVKDLQKLSEFSHFHEMLRNSYLKRVRNNNTRMI